MRITISRAGRFLLPALLLLPGAAGCGKGLYPVHGTVTYEDGKPFTNGMVVFESAEGPKPVTARGDVQSDGSYQLSTNKPGDGVPAGKYRVLVSPRVDISADAPERNLSVDKRYTEFATSGLEFEVKDGPNEFPIRVSRPAKLRR
jgi:hypothetical protein